MIRSSFQTVNFEYKLSRKSVQSQSGSGFQYLNFYTIVNQSVKNKLCLIENLKGLVFDLIILMFQFSFLSEHFGPSNK